MKKSFKYILIAVIVAPVAFGIGYAMFSTPSDRALFTLEQVLDEAPGATTHQELNAHMAKVDTVLKHFPEHQAWVDSLITPQVDAWRADVNERVERQTIRDAYYVAQQFVKDRLKAPSTARMATFNSNESKAWKDGNIYISQFWCEAQNALGVPLRNNYQVKLRIKDGEFKLVDFRTD